MTTVMPQAESLCKAAKWNSEELKADDSQNKIKLVNEAIFHFDLSPKDGEFSINIYKGK